MNKNDDYGYYQYFDDAKARVEESSALRPYADMLLADWPEGDEHYEWVLTAPEAELIEWAELGRAD